MSVKQWAEAEALWESGDVTLDQLAAKFSRNRSTFQRYFTDKGIKRGSSAAEHAKGVKEAVAAAAIDESTVLASRIRETKEEHYKMASGLSRLIWSEVLKAREGGHAMATILNNVKALDVVATALKKTREERWAILGLDKEDFLDEDGLPELVVSELTAEQVEALRARDETDLEMDLELVKADEADGVRPAAQRADVDDEDEDELITEGDD